MLLAHTTGGFTLKDAAAHRFGRVVITLTGCNHACGTRSSVRDEAMLVTYGSNTYSTISSYAGKALVYFIGCGQMQT